MITYIIRRLLQTIPVVLGVTFVTFFVMNMLGSPIALMANPDWSQKEYDDFVIAFGFDKNVVVRYGNFLFEAVQGDLGDSLRQRVPNTQLVFERLPATLELALAATLLSTIIGLPLGIISALNRNRLWDRLSMFPALLGQSIPNFWLALMLMLVFGVFLEWLPVAGRGGFKHLILPTIALSCFPIARNARLVRSSMLEVLSQDYIRTARAKGLTELTVVTRHALKNAFIPVLTTMNLQFGFLLGGTVVIESIFAWPGVGRLILNAISQRDLPLVIAAVIVLAIFFVFINLLTDILYRYLDPRIRYT